MVTENVDDDDDEEEEEEERKVENRNKNLQVFF